MSVIAPTDVTQILGRIDAAGGGAATAGAIFLKRDGDKRRFINLERFSAAISELPYTPPADAPLAAAADAAAPIATEALDALWRAVGGYLPARVVVVKEKGFFDTLKENVLGTPDRFAAVQKDAFGLPVKNPVGVNLSEAEIGAALAAIALDGGDDASAGDAPPRLTHAALARALELGTDGAASAQRLGAVKLIAGTATIEGQ